MTEEILEPRVDLLRQEYVLVQAWKKTASYIRHHNWFSDTIELDRAAVNLPRFLAEIAEQLSSPEQWVNDPLRIVPAPKSQQWRVTPDTKRWEPVNLRDTATQLRPLAHVCLKDQVAATAAMLCLANRVETIQGNPSAPITEVGNRRRVISYGNRLFCDARGPQLFHRWGSAKLYRAYYQDYGRFLSRPEKAAEAVVAEGSSRVVIVHSDLRQFYDRVRPELLIQKLDALKGPNDDPRFYAFARRLLNWEWDRRDSQEVERYAKNSNITNFSQVALPQGLVAAGFFANVALLDFDQGLRAAMSQDIEPGVRLDDACRYVDDLRIVLTIDREKALSDIEALITKWLQQLLDQHANGLLPADDKKTRAAMFRGEERPLVQQSRKMARIQSAVSGGFDAIGGEEILDAVQGLVRAQQRYSEQRTQNEGWPFLPIPDVRDATVSRFAAWRFRNTYRSLRPLLAGRAPAMNQGRVEYDASERSRVTRTRAELDDEARAFALGLIENWVEDPSNVRLLRIALDLWPADDVLRSILNLLRPFTEKGGRRKAPRRVAWYCLSEIFRAGATETGFVEDDESLPDKIDIAAYRSTLRTEAVRLISLPAATLPWYLKQQLYLFLAASDPTEAPIDRTGLSVETRHYREIIRYLRGDGDGLKGVDFATLAILSRRAFLSRDKALALVDKGITVRRLEQIAERDPSFGLEILANRPELSTEVSPRLRDDLCLDGSAENDGWTSLSQIVLRGEPNGPLRNEISLLRFASSFLTEWVKIREIEVVSPVNVLLKLRIEENGISDVQAIKIIPSRVTASGSMYHPPDWCPPAERWRIQLGYLLRFILSARQDFTQIVRPYHRKDRTDAYRVPESHWYQRLYGLFNGHAAFGDDWLPISDWTEQLLFALLNWPGCRSSPMVRLVVSGLEKTRAGIDRRLSELTEKEERSTRVLMMPLAAPMRRPAQRPLRACVVQTVIPTPGDFKATDLVLSDSLFRRRHRNHLSTALAAIVRMLDLRETHKGRDGRLDWLILPELSVHPRDVRTHLVPFARAYKTIILAGLTYEALFAGKPLINSALWVIPVWSEAHGLQVLTRRQGKCYLAPNEEQFNSAGPVLQGFRPCQWLIGYEWSHRVQDPPLWLTSSICYDATDIRLAADLRHRSDVFAIPALNKDVNTFDQMALALHYHMFQMVIVANNGHYGGSNAYFPDKEPFVRQVFHMHGQPQASVVFLEIDDIAGFIARKTDALLPAPTVTQPPRSIGNWKYPPAGL